MPIKTKKGLNISGSGWAIIANDPDNYTAMVGNHPHVCGYYRTLGAAVDSVIRNLTFREHGIESVKELTEIYEKNRAKVIKIINEGLPF
jgi:hypothetical protein